VSGCHARRHRDDGKGGEVVDRAAIMTIITSKSQVPHDFEYLLQHNST
jgi:hypothetical protein